MNLSRNFTLDEFEAVSHIPLTSEHKEKAELFALAILQPMRDTLGFPICVTSFVRSRNVGGGAHATGSAIDFVACDRSSSKLEDMFQFLKIHAVYGELIHERNHLHITLPGVGGLQETLREPRESEFVPESVDYTLEPIYANVTRQQIVTNSRVAIAGLITAFFLLTASKRKG